MDLRQDRRLEAKGMRMGGYVPLGYEPDGRTLTINEAEARTVRALFRLNLEHGNVRRVKEQADRLGLTTKLRNGGDGRMRGGRALSRSYNYKLLGNPFYIGRIARKKMTYEGQHPAIIDAETWDAAQAKLATGACERSSGARATESSPLIGKLFDERGAPLTPTHAVKAGRRYRYYESKQLLGGTVAENKDQSGWRLPAREIDRMVGQAVQRLLADRAALAHAARDGGMAAKHVSRLLDAAAQWRGEILDLVRRVDLRADRTAINLDLLPLSGEAGVIVCHAMPGRIKRRGVEMRLVLDGPGTQAARSDPALIKVVARAHRWFDDLVTSRVQSLVEIAKREGVSDRYVSHLMPFAFLAPVILEAILEGAQPVDLTAERLTKYTNLPLIWSEQTVLLQFD
ncbi:MAG TPA: recombinase family protein [Gammaproteobacteria bacterium]|nr:recombinase family protein [Gammaproteobacteria bacterium]